MGWKGRKEGGGEQAELRSGEAGSQHRCCTAPSPPAAKHPRSSSARRKGCAPKATGTPEQRPAGPARENPRRPRAGSRPCTHTGRSGGLGSQRSTGCRPRPPLSAAAPGAGPAPPPPASCGPARPRPERHRPRAAERQLPGTPQPPPAPRSLRVSAESR